MEDIAFVGGYSFYWKLFILVGIFPFSGSQWKSFQIVEAIPFRESFCFSWKSLPVVETLSFSRYYFFLEEATPFNWNFSF